MKNLLFTFFFITTVYGTVIAQSNSDTFVSILDLEKLTALEASEFTAHLVDNGFTVNKRTGTQIICSRKSKGGILMVSREKIGASILSVGLVTSSKERYIKIKNSLSYEGYKFRYTSGNMEVYSKSSGPPDVTIAKGTEAEAEVFTITITGRSKNPNDNRNEQKIANEVEIYSGPPQGNISVKRGNTISISATGNIKFGAFAGSGDADGIDGLTGYNKIAGFRHGALLGRIGDGPWFLVGTDASFIADRSGTLTLIVNDADPSNNSGSFIVEYSINNSSNSTTDNNLSFADLFGNTSNSTTNNASNIDDNKFLIRNYYNTRIYFELSRDKSTWTSYSLAGSSKSDYWYTDQQQSFFRIKALKEKVYKIEAGKKYKIDWNKSEWCFDLFPDGDR